MQKEELFELLIQVKSVIKKRNKPDREIVRSIDNPDWKINTIDSQDTKVAADEKKEKNKLLLTKALRVVYKTFFEMEFETARSAVTEESQVEPDEEDAKEFEQEQADDLTYERLIFFICEEEMIQKLRKDRRISPDNIGYLSRLIDGAVHPLEAKDFNSWFRSFKTELNLALTMQSSMLNPRKPSSQ